MQIERLTVEPSDRITVSDLRTYANISDTTLDNMLNGFLSTALTAVEKSLNMSLRVATYKIYNDVAEVQLYYPPIASITSVQDLDGNDLTYTQKGNYVILDGAQDSVIIYETEPNIVSDIKTAVLRYAAALYDGQDAKVLKDILRTI